MSDPDFDFDMVRRFFEAAVKHDQTVSKGGTADVYAQPGYVDVKIGFYISYELTKLRQEAVAKAVKDKTTPAPQTRTIARSSVRVKMPIPGTSGTYTVPMKYLIQYPDVVLEPVHRVGPPFDFVWDEYLERIKTAKDYSLHLTVTRTLGDAVHDSGAELARCGFIFHKDLTGMTASGRRAYAKNLKEISFVPADAAPDAPIYVPPSKDNPQSYYEDKGVQFKKLLARTCTYDSNGDYHGKWNAAALKQRVRSYVGPNLSPAYLTRTTAEYELEQGYYYALLTSPVVQRLYRISPDKKKGDRLDLLVNLDESMVIPPGSDELEELPRPELIIFKAQHGLKRGSTKGVKLPSFSYPKVEGAHRRLADPQREVEGDIGKEAAKKLRARSDFDWFVELVKLRFTDSLYTIDITRAMEEARAAGVNDFTFLPSYRAESRDALAQELWAWAGKNPIRLAGLEKIKVVLEDETKLVIPQGLMISDQVKFVGLDADFAYARDLVNNVTLKMPHTALVAELSVRHMAKTLYKNSEGMIYVSQIIVWGGLAAMGAAIIPGVFAARTIYRAVVNRIRGYAVDKAVKQILIYEIPAMAALVAEIIAGLFAGSSQEAKRWEAFAGGFFKGYAQNTLKKTFLDIDEGLARAVLKEWYLYQRLKKLRQTVKKLSAKYEELSGKLDREHVKKLIAKFEDAAKPAIPVVLVLFQMIAFLEHKDAEDLIAGISASLGDDSIEKLQKEEWYQEAKEGVVGGVEAVGKFLTGTGKKAFDAVDGVFEFVEEHENALAAVALGFAAHNLLKQMAALKQSKATKSSPRKIVIVVAGILGGGAVLHFATDGESTKLISQVGQRFRSTVPGGNEREAKLRGEIYGTALGALFFDHGLIGSKSALGRLAKHDKTAKRVRKKLKHGIFMPLLTLAFERYVVFFRKALGHDGDDGDVKGLLQDLSQWRTDSKELAFLDAYRGTETGTDVREIMASVLNLKRFLDREVRDRWKAKWGPNLQAYEADLTRFREDAQALGLEELAKKHAPVVGYAMLAQLRTVVRNIEEMFRALAAEIDVAFDGDQKLSLLRFVEMLGFDLGDLDEVASQFDDEMQQLAKDYKQ